MDACLVYLSVRTHPTGVWELLVKIHVVKSITMPHLYFSKSSRL